MPQKIRFPRVPSLILFITVLSLSFTNYTNTYASNNTPEELANYVLDTMKFNDLNSFEEYAIATQGDLTANLKSQGIPKEKQARILETVNNGYDKRKKIFLIHGLKHINEESNMVWTGQR